MLFKKILSKIFKNNNRKEGSTRPTEQTVADVHLSILLKSLEELESTFLSIEDKSLLKSKEELPQQHKYSEYADSYFPSRFQYIITKYLEILFRTVVYDDDKIHSTRIYGKEQQQELMSTAAAHFSIINGKKFSFISFFNLESLMNESLIGIYVIDTNLMLLCRLKLPCR